MKILFVCKSLPPDIIGGIQTHTWKLSEWMIRMGHQVCILTAGNWKRGVQHSLCEGRTIIKIPYLPGRKLPFVSVLAEEWAFNLAANRWLGRNEEAFDIIHVQGRSGFCFPGKNLSTPIVATFHGLIYAENEHAYRDQSPKLDTRLHQRWSSFFEKKTLRYADACIAVSREMVRQMETFEPDIARKTMILPNGVDIPEPPASTSGTSRDLVFVGRLARIKGVFPLIEAMKKVNPAIRLHLVGKGPERSEMERRIAVAGLGERIFFAGALNEEQVFEKIRNSFALVLPSFYESQGIVLLEANACGKPVITSDIRGIQEVVRQGETGWMSPAGDADLLAATINHVYDHPAEAAEMGEAGRRHVQENYAWEKIAHDTERLYGTVLAQKNYQHQSRISSRAIPVWAHS